MKNTIALTLFLLITFLIARPLLAAEIRLDAHKTKISSGEQFSVDLILHGEESINALEGRLSFPIDKMTVKDISDGNSIINFWIEKPHIGNPGSIVFSGITPGGFSGPNNQIFSIVFEAKKDGLASVMVDEIKALQNDGLGSQLTLSMRNVTVSILPGDSNIHKEILIDTELPEKFDATITSDPNIFDGRHFIVFNTQDKISGIAGYKIREGNWGFYATAESPYVLKHQSLDRKIFIKAIDISGNERIAEIDPIRPIAWYENMQYWFIIISILLIGLLVKELKIKIWRK